MYVPSTRTHALAPYPPRWVCRAHQGMLFTRLLPVHQRPSFCVALHTYRRAFTFHGNPNSTCTMPACSNIFSDDRTMITKAMLAECSSLLPSLKASEGPLASRFLVLVLLLSPVQTAAARQYPGAVHPSTVSFLIHTSALLSQIRISHF